MGGDLCVRHATLFATPHIAHLASRLAHWGHIWWYLVCNALCSVKPTTTWIRFIYDFYIQIGCLISPVGVQSPRKINSARPKKLFSCLVRTVNRPCSVLTNYLKIWWLSMNSKRGPAGILVHRPPWSESPIEPLHGSIWIHGYNETACLWLFPYSSTRQDLD